MRWVLRVSVLVVGVLATLIAVFSNTIYGLYVLCSDLMYVILFPQLTLVLWVDSCNAYGSLTGNKNDKTKQNETTTKTTATKQQQQQQQQQQRP